MTARAAFRQADVERALRAADAVGLKVASMRIVPGTGEIALEFEGTAANSSGRRLLDRLHAA
jgi:hypothetical protein